VSIDDAFRQAAAFLASLAHVAATIIDADFRALATDADFYTGAGDWLMRAVGRGVAIVGRTRIAISAIGFVEATLDAPTVAAGVAVVAI